MFHRMTPTISYALPPVLPIVATTTWPCERLLLMLLKPVLSLQLQVIITVLNCVAFICYDSRLTCSFSLHYLSNFSSIILSHSWVLQLLLRLPSLQPSADTFSRTVERLVNRSSSLREIRSLKKNTDFPSVSFDTLTFQTIEFLS